MVKRYILNYDVKILHKGNHRLAVNALLLIRAVTGFEKSQSGLRAPFNGLGISHQAILKPFMPVGKFLDFDALNKYFSISGMPIASSQYWNEVHGYTPEDVRKDEEGMQTMRVLGRNMAFLIKSIALGKEKFGLPEKEQRIFTPFIR